MTIGRRFPLALAGCALALLAAGCAGAPRPATEFDTGLGLARRGLPQRVEDVKVVTGRLARDGRVWIGGQPDSTALVTLAARGVRTLVCFRTPEEMDDRKEVPFDEAALAKRLGMEFVSIPFGGEKHPPVPGSVDRLAAVLRDRPGQVLLHCGVGARASSMWVAYLVRHQGYGLQEALARGRAINLMPSSLEGLLGKPLTFTYR